jgi:hypothetical protein
VTNVINLSPALSKKVNCSVHQNSDAPRDRDDDRNRDKGDRDRNDRERMDRDRDTRTERDSRTDRDRTDRDRIDRDRNDREEVRPKEKKLTRAELEALKKERVALVKRLTHGKFNHRIIII